MDTVNINIIWYTDGFDPKNHLDVLLRIQAHSKKLQDDDIN